MSDVFICLFILVSKILLILLLQIEVQESASSSDVVTIAINRPANVVEKKVPELEK